MTDVAGGGAEYNEAIAQKRAQLLREEAGWPFGELLPGKYGVIYADPPWAFNLWWGGRSNKTPAGVPSRATVPHYNTMREPELNALPIADLAARDCVLFMWICWPVLEWSLRTIKAWGFEYKTCGFAWVKAHAQQVDMFRDDIEPHMTLGYWTRSNSEVCLLATRGKPKRIATDVRQAIIEPRREHSRKPDIHSRIERLVPGPYCELFARTTRPGWDSWGNETNKFSETRAQARTEAPSARFASSDANASSQALAVDVDVPPASRDASTASFGRGA